MIDNFSHSQIENVIQALADPDSHASDYMVLRPDGKIEHELYNEIRLYKEALLILNLYRRPDQNIEWDKMKKKIERPNVKMYNFLKVAASLIILFAIGYYLSVEMKKTYEKDYHKLAEAITIGSPKAILTTSEGVKIRLTELEPLQIKALGVNITINKDSATIEYLTDEKKQKSKVKDVEFHEIEVPEFSDWNVVLPDGTKVCINAASKLRYPLEFTGNERSVFLTGEACFEVVKDENKPFVVNTEKIDTKVLGTTFNVNAYPDEDVNITLVEGSVQLHNKLNNQKYKLEPNDNAALKLNETKLKISKVNASKLIAWKNGYYYFEREQLQSIMKKLQKWYDFQVFYEDANTKYYEFRMRADRKLSFGEIVKRLEETGRVEVDIIENAVLIKDVKRN